MRKRLLLLAAMFPGPLVAQAPRDSVISVSASRVTPIVADRASIYLLIEGTAETPTDAIARLDTKVRGVTDALRPLAPRVELDPPVSYGVGPTSNANGYPGAASAPINLARSVIRVHLDRLDQLASVMATALGAGATATASLTFESSVADSVRRSRIREVMGAARLDAEAVAASLGGRLGSLVSVSTSGSSYAFQGPSNLNFDTRYSGQQAQTPMVQITTSVTMQFRLSR